jgi:DNA-binding MarR family transcriptional regulator
VPVDFAFNDMTLRLWVLLRQTDISLLRCEETVFSEIGITLNQYYVLIAIRNLKNPATPANIARWLDRSPNSITTIIDRMAKDDLVERVRDLKDRRSLQVVITAKGQAVFARSTKPAMILMKKLMSCLSDAETATLLRLLEKLRGSAYEELKPSDPMEKLEIDATRKIAILLSKE